MVYPVPARVKVIAETAPAAMDAVAVAPEPRAMLTSTSEEEGYPLPPPVTFIAVTAPSVITAVAVAPDPDAALKDTAGGRV